MFIFNYRFTQSIVMDCGLVKIMVDLEAKQNFVFFKLVSEYTKLSLPF